MSNNNEINYNGYHGDILDNISILVCCYYPDFTIKYVNKAYCDFFNKSREELIGKSFLTLIPQNDQESVINEILSLNYDKPERVHTHKVLAGNGDIGWQHWTNKAVFDNSGKPVFYYSFGKDITEHKRSGMEILRNRKLLEKERDFAESIINTAQAIILVLDCNGKIVSINPYMEEISGYTIKEVQGKDWFDTFLKKEIRQDIRKVFRQAVNDIRTKGNINSIITKDGKELQIEWYDKTLRDDNNQITGVLSVGLDITDRLRAEEQLRISEARYRKVTTLISDWIFELEIQNNNMVVTFLGGPFQEVIGYSYDDVKYPEDWGKVVYKDDLLDFKSFFKNLFLKKGEGNIEIRIYHKDGKLTWYNVNCRTESTPDGKIKLIGTATNIHRRKEVEQGLLELNKTLESMAYQDTLTGTVNRKPFIELFTRSVRSAERKNEKLALLFLDLEKFKTVNDIYGHSFGDKVLRRSAELIRSCIRSTDIIGRLGGDEFLVCLGDIRCIDDAIRIASKINNAFSAGEVIDGIPVNVTVSIGISIYPDDSRDIHDLLKNSDLAMYKAKKESHNSFQIYNKRYRKEILFEQALSRALYNNEYEVYYQPIVNSSGRCEIVESLLRWNNPEFGFVLPSDFIHILEKHKSINDVGKWVFREVCRQLAEINQTNDEFSQTKMSINLSGIQIENKKFLDSFFKIMSESGVRSHNIIFEITEEQKIKDIEYVISVMSELKRRSYSQIALDDYGSGFSSFLNITKLPIDIVKIDKPLIQNMNDKLLCSATLGLVSLIKNLGLRVVAEGVENEDQFVKLKNAGCDYFQGFLFSEPVLDIKERLLLKKGYF